MQSINSTISNLEKNPDGGKTVLLKDMASLYKQVPEKENQNKPIYKVFVKNFYPINIAETLIYPGTIGKEFHMTKGHVHKSGKEEFYILLEGKGSLLLQKNNKPRTIKLKKGELTLIHKGEAHRLVNIGKTPLKAMSIYHEDSKPSYEIKFKKRIFRK